MGGPPPFSLPQGATKSRGACVAPRLCQSLSLAGMSVIPCAFGVFLRAGRVVLAQLVAATLLIGVAYHQRLYFCVDELSVWFDVILHLDMCYFLITFLPLMITMPL